VGKKGIYTLLSKGFGLFTDFLFFFFFVLFLFVVVHFRQLRGNQGFAIDHDKADQFAKKASKTN
jgi:hypothetical protein